MTRVNKFVALENINFRKELETRSRSGKDRLDKLQSSKNFFRDHLHVKA